MSVREGEVVPATIDQLHQVLRDDSRKGDWFGAGADAGASEDSYKAYTNLCSALLGVCYEGGFPLHVFVSMMGSRLRELDREAQAQG